MVQHLLHHYQQTKSITSFQLNITTNKQIPILQDAIVKLESMISYL
jgi:hypothetical protein